MKKIFITILIIAVGLVVFFYTQKTPNQPQPVENLKTYRSTKLGISFSFPSTLSASTTSDAVTVHHDIPYRNNGDCDMVGDETVYERLTDLKFTYRILNKNIVGSMKEVSPYIPQENFVNNTVVESPGFIDSYSMGEFTGYAIYEGAEGCGQTTYYFQVGSNKTLIIHKMSIQLLSGVISEEKQNEVLKVPGVISRQESDIIFENILKTLKVN